MTSRVVLIGMMGVGKSTVGAALAARLGWPHLDTDEEIVRLGGSTISEIFATRGEAAFRAEEARVVAAATTSDGPLVVSVGGGAVLDPDNRQRMKRAGVVVWLRAEAATLAAQVGSGAGRPLLGGDPLAAIGRLIAERRDLYAAAADVVVDVDGHTAAAVAEIIQRRLARRGTPARV